VHLRSGLRRPRPAGCPHPGGGRLWSGPDNRIDDLEEQEGAEMTALIQFAARLALMQAVLLCVVAVIMI